jgi:hypothetical protein
MFRPLPFLLLLAAPAFAGAGDPGLLDRYSVVTAAPVSTWVYVGTVTLNATPFIRHGGQYAARYTAKVFPYFFYNESGAMLIDVSDDALRKLAAGAAIAFTGRATRSDGAVRTLDGTATSSGAAGGTIKVKIHVSKKVTLVFDTTYRVGSPAPLKASGAR